MEQEIVYPEGFEWLAEPECCNPFDFVARIAASVFPELSKRAGEKRVRAKIAYGFKQKKGRRLKQCHEAFAKQGEVMTEEFYEWALGAFPKLRGAAWIHRHWKSQRVEVAVGLSMRHRQSVPPGPALTPDQLKICELQKCIEERDREIKDRDREIRKLTVALASAEERLRKIEEKDARTRSLKAAAGKKGGRGNTAW